MPEVSHLALVAWLREPRSYPEQPARIDLVETHISQVFLGPQFVYKLKKPVRFEFLDFSTPELRRQACDLELRLNRRLAPQVYLDVLAVTAQDDGSLAFNGAGTPVDWVVKMRRLPAERMLDQLIERRQVSLDELDLLAARLAEFYAAAAPVSCTGDEYRHAIGHHVRANLRDLLASGLDEAQVRPVHTAQLRLLLGRPDLFDARTAQRRIVDGHGDLRPEHVCLLQPPVVFDCVEFSSDLRRADVADELCFLAMECDLLGAREVGQRVLDACLSRLGDRPAAPLLAFYQSYRACVRAKVAALQAAQAGGLPTLLDRAGRYLAAAAGYLRGASLPPLLLLVMGLSGSGKTTLARAVAEQLGTAVFSTDVVRRQMWPPGDGPQAFAAGRYASQARQQVYEALFRLASERLARGESVVLDGTFNLAATREAAWQLARQRGAQAMLVECVCPREEALRRIAARLEQAIPDESEARPELYDAQAAERQSGAGLEGALRVDTTVPLADQVRRVLACSP